MRKWRKNWRIRAGKKSWCYGDYLVDLLLLPPRPKYLSRARRDGGGGAPSLSSCPRAVRGAKAAPKMRSGTALTSQLRVLWKQTERLIVKNWHWRSMVEATFIPVGTGATRGADAIEAPKRAPRLSAQRHSPYTTQGIMSRGQGQWVF